ncbi:MAG: hypothetical protein NDJ90_04430 [Oligoflexia bacterium]|nr:hypothetical protein [Oligoflexia bacterium]
MTSTSRYVYPLLALVMTGAAWAQPLRDNRTDDSDITPKAPILLKEEVPLELSPDEMHTASDAGTLSIQVLREDHGKPTPVSGLTFSLARASAESTQATTDQDGHATLPACPEGQKARILAPLERQQFSITQGGPAYKITAEIPCQGSTTLLFHSDTAGGQALGIWQIAVRAEQKLSEAVGLDFWFKPLRFVWPADGDYYSGGLVRITRGDAWDVVGHELGHGIYALASLGLSSGGQHKIDECYSRTLALSEGWASYFSAWLSIDLADPDAKFEFMVPRRAPIRFEHIPADVCRGERNEWRVTGFFWDLVDHNDDGENVQELFARLWNAMRKSSAASASDVRLRLLQQGFDAETLKAVWEQNLGD